MAARGNLDTSKIISYTKPELLTSSFPLYGGGRIPKTQTVLSEVLFRVKS